MINKRSTVPIKGGFSAIVCWSSDGLMSYVFISENQNMGRNTSSFITLKAMLAARHYQGVTYTRHMFIQGLNRCCLMNHACIIEQHERPRLCQRKTNTCRARRFKNARFAPLDSLPTNQKDCNQINAITVRALGCRPPYSIRRINTKLMRFHKARGCCRWSKQLRRELCQASN